MQQQQQQKEYENHQIFRIDGKDVFVEVMKSMFDKGKVVLNFIQYDNNRSAGNKIKEQIAVFIDIPEFLQLSQDMKSGRLAVLGKQANQKAKEAGYMFAQAIYTNLGGTSVESLQRQGKARPDGKPLSRQFKITPGSRAPWMLSAETGPGERMKTGIIAPKYGNKPEKIIRVPMSDDHFKQLFLMTEFYLQAHITTEMIYAKRGK